MQHLTITGRLTRDPELRELPNGGSVCKLRLAVDDMAPGRETGYINVSAFGKPGEAAAKVLSTGWLVAVDGRLDRLLGLDRAAVARRGEELDAADHLVVVAGLAVLLPLVVLKAPVDRDQPAG